ISLKFTLLLLFFSSHERNPNLKQISSRPSLPRLSLDPFQTPSFSPTPNRRRRTLSLPLSPALPVEEHYLPREERPPVSDDGREAGARRRYKGIEAEACPRRRDGGAAAPNAHARTTSLGGRRRRRRGEGARQRRRGRRGGDK
ncbi:hypothetical protein LINPERPRIM_LOCUS38441, partial [Linum perenne]